LGVVMDDEGIHTFEELAGEGDDEMPK
jgi:hypothetical protein